MRVIVRPRPSFTVPNLIAKQCERQPDAQLPPVVCYGGAVHAQQLLDKLAARVKMWLQDWF